jgi:hypothetical protein
MENLVTPEDGKFSLLNNGTSSNLEDSIFKQIYIGEKIYLKIFSE